MNDFASAAMLRVLHAGMRKLGLQSPAQQWLDQATVPLNAKQQLVMQVLQERGISALLQLGQGLHDVRHDSLMPMLIHPSQPLRVLQAWLRLERYLHSKHRIEQTMHGENSVTHRHYSLAAGAFPSAAEDLVVIGVLISLLESAGCDGLQVHLSHGLCIWPAQTTAGWQAALVRAFANRQTDGWRISWHSVRLPPSPVGTIVPTHGDQISSSERLQTLVLKMQGETIRLTAAAKLLGISSRSLQRSLQLEGARFTEVLASARAQLAATLLSQNQVSLAEIGFSCGYTDQAHFCRDFKRRVVISPQLYRSHTLVGYSSDA